MRPVTIKKVIIGLLTTAIVTTAVWYAFPKATQALDITFPSFPASGYIGQPYTFKVLVSIEDQEFLPIRNINLIVESVTSGPIIHCTNIPLTNETRLYPDPNGYVQVMAVTSGFTHGYGYRKGIGNWVPGKSGNLGYGYGYGIPTQSIIYTIIWTPSSKVSTGNYFVKIIAYGNDTRTLTSTSKQFTLLVPLTPEASTVIQEKGVTNLIPYTDSRGKIIIPTTAYSDDGLVWMDLPAGTTATSADGHRLNSISIKQMKDPPDPPRDTQIIGLVYEFQPENAKFSPPVTLSLSYDPAKLPEGVDAEKMVVAVWDKTTGKWTERKCKVDTIKNIITLEIDGFSSYAILAYNRPAVFQIKNLLISPTEARINETIRLSATIINTGDLTGIYNLILKINNEVETKIQIAIKGRTEYKATITTKKDVAGSYSVDLNGLEGTLKVIPAEVPQARFAYDTLSINPSLALIGETINISVNVTNTGNLSGTEKVNLRIDGKIVSSKDIILGPGRIEMIRFTITPEQPGVHLVTIADLSGRFTIEPKPDVPKKQINWWIIGLAIAVVIATTVIITIVLRRRTT